MISVTFMIYAVLLQLQTYNMLLTALRHTVLLCKALYCTLLYSNVPQHTTPHHITLHCASLHHTKSHHTSLHCTAQRSGCKQCSALHSLAMKLVCYERREGSLSSLLWNGAMALNWTITQHNTGLSHSTIQDYITLQYSTPQ